MNARVYRRVVKICCYSHEQKLVLQIFEAREDHPSSSEPPRNTCFSTSPNSSNIDQYLMDAVRYYNLWTDEDTRRFLVDRQGFKLTKNTRDSPTIRYFTNNLTGNFSTHVSSFLRVFGAIAGIVATIIRNSEKRKLKTAIDVEAHAVPMSDQVEPLIETFKKANYIILNPENPLREDKLNSLPEDLMEQLYRCVMETIHSNQESLSAYKPVYEKLLELSHPPQSISKSIQQAMDSHRGLENYLQSVQEKNPTIAPIYNVTVPIATRTQTLLGNFIAEISQCSATDAKQINALKVAKKKFFDPIQVQNGEDKCIQQAIWCYILRKMLGKGPATDGKFYTEKHTEVGVLRVAKLSVHANGLMELLYKLPENEEYAKHYAHKHSEFVKDIKKLFDHLDLPLHANTSDLDERIFFSKEASQYFIHHGLHLSRQYVETCLVTSHRYREFKKVTNEFFGDIPILKRILKLAAPTQLLEDDFEWACNRFTKK